MIEIKPTNNPLLHHRNKTSKYLKPILGHYFYENQSFVDLQNKCLPIAYGVADFMYDDYNEETIKQDIIKNNSLYIMLDLNGIYRFDSYPKQEEYKCNTLDFVKKFKDLGVITEFYPFCGEIDNNQWMITIPIPHEFGNIMEKFIFGRYSEMYTKSQIDQYIKTYVIVKNQKALSETKQILTKDKAFVKTFEERLIKEFKLSPSFKIDNDIELDVPPILTAEVFNLEYVQLNKLLV